MDEKELKDKILRKSTLEYVGGFGTGKTTFLTEFFEKNSNEFEVLWFNAFEFDYSSNPKVVFVNEVIMSILKKLPLAKFEDRAKKFLKIIKNIFFNSIALNLQKWGLDVKDAKEDNEWITIIKNYQNEKSKINELKKLLIETINELSPSDNEKKNLVLVIDDLDRARPDFALEILEISKHIFDVENLSIIFVYDRQTMDSMTIKKYGKPSGERYLKKYIEDTYFHKNVDLLEDNKNYYITKAFKMTYGNWTAREIASYDVKSKISNISSDYYMYTGSDNASFWFLFGFLLAIKTKEEDLFSGTFLKPNGQSYYSLKKISNAYDDKWNFKFEIFSYFVDKQHLTLKENQVNYLSTFKDWFNENKIDDQSSNIIMEILMVL